MSVTLIDIASNALAPEAHLLCALGNCRFIEACLWELPETTPPVEWGICTDVLEHIPEEKVEKVIAGIAQHVTKGALLNIALGTDVWGEGIGQDLHLTVKPREWWREKLDPYFEQEEHFKKADAFHTVLVTPKNALKEK